MNHFYPDGELAAAIRRQHLLAEAEHDRRLRQVPSAHPSRVLSAALRALAPLRALRRPAADPCPAPSLA